MQTTVDLVVFGSGGVGRRNDRGMSEYTIDALVFSKRFIVYRLPARTPFLWMHHEAPGLPFNRSDTMTAKVAPRI